MGLVSGSNHTVTQTGGNITASSNGNVSNAGGGMGVVLGSNHTVTQTGGNISASTNGDETIAGGGWVLFSVPTTP